MEKRKPFYQLIDGVPRCANVDPVAIRRALNFKAGMGDLVQWSYPKSGTHWVQYLIQLILKEGGTIDSYEEFSRHTRPMEYVDIDGWKSSLPIRCFATHLPPRLETLSNEGRYIYVARNPWDICVSLFHMVTNLSIYKFEDGTFDEFFETFLNGDFGYGSYFDHVASGYAIREAPNVLFLTYEALKADIRTAVIKLAHFLGHQHGARLEDSENDLLDQILERSSPGYMKSVIVMNLAGGETNEWDAMMTRNKMRCRNGYGGDCTKYGIVRNAKVGDWRNYFKPEQLQLLESKIQAQGEKASFMHLWDDIRNEALKASRL